MMNHKPRLSLLVRVLLLPTALLTVTPIHVGAQARPVARTFVAGQLVMYCQPGTPQADVNALAGMVGAVTIKKNLLPDFYTLVLPPNKNDDASVLNAVALLKTDPRVKWTNTNLLPKHFVATASPNDPRYQSGEQWALKMMNLPQAWAIQKGSATANVADIDTAFNTVHEDLIGQYDLVNSYNWADNNTILNPPSAANELNHGIMTSSVMIAKTNNAKGIAGILGWSNAKCVGLRDTGDTGNGGLDVSVNCLMDVLGKQAKAHIVALNMSWGYPGIPPSDTTS